MANPSLQPIYNRINGVSNYHPYTADTFADWSLEAGDIVTVSQDGNEYASPIHATTLRWNGQQQMELESHGERKRESLSKMSANSFNYGAGGGNGYRGGYRGAKTNKDMDTRIASNAEAIILEAWDRTDADNELQSQISVTASEIRAEVSNKTTKAALILAITDGVSSATLTADVIDINGIVSALAARKIGVGSLEVEGRAEFKGSIYGESTITAEEAIRSNTGFNVGGVGLKVSDVTVSGNTLTITYADGRPAQTFSKATTLSGEWSGNITAGKSYKVTAKQNNIAVGSPHYSPALDGYYNTKSWASDYKSVDVTVTVYDENGTDLFRDTLNIDTTNAYEAGKSAAGSYTLFGYFDKYGTVTVEGQTYTAYITQSTSASASHLALYKK